jgi:hypothetical protein
MSASEEITPDDLLNAMVGADVLETFCQLPRADQEKFSYWIGKARDDESHWRRIHALVLALRSGPIHSRAPEESVYEPRAVG